MALPSNLRHCCQPLCHLSESWIAADDGVTSVAVDVTGKKKESDAERNAIEEVRWPISGRNEEMAFHLGFMFSGPLGRQLGAGARIARK